VKAARCNHEDEASNNGNDKEGNLDGLDIMFGVVESLDVLLLAVPIGSVELVGVNDNLSVLVVLSGENVINKVTHELSVRLLLGRL